MELAALTANQERYLLAETGATDSFFITVWYPCDRAPDLDRLQNAIWAVIAEEPALRTGFERDREHGFRSIVRPSVRPLVHLLDVGDVDTASISRATAGHLAKLQDFDEPAALQHYFVVRSTDGQFALVFSQHHAISDGRSLDLFIERIAANYSGSDTDPVSVSIANSGSIEGDLESSEDYFRSQLQAESSFPTFHRDRSGSHSLTVRSLDLDVTQSALLQAEAAASSPFSLLAAAFAAQIHGQTGSSDVLISIQSSGRAETSRRALGSLSNALAINVQIDPAENFRAFAQRVRSLVRAAVAHEAMPYHRVQALTGAKADFALNLYPDASTPGFSGLVLGPRRFLPSPSDYGINLRWQRHLEGTTPRYEAEAYFDQGSISPERIEHFLARHRRILVAALSDPTISVGELVSTSRCPLNAKELPTTLPALRLFDLFLRTAESNPHAAAIRFKGGAISYQELADRIESRASLLAAAGLGAGQRVAFIERRSPAFVVEMLALSRLGATFAAFDPAYPAGRMLEQAHAFKADWILADPDHFGDALRELREGGWASAEVPSATTDLRPAPQPPSATADDIAYVLFTSGTTGRPRAVGVGHSAIPAFVEWQRSAFEIDQTDRVSMLSGLSHDPVMRDIFLPLSCGGTLLIPEEQTMQDARALWAWLQAEAPTVSHATPPLGRLLKTITGDEPALPSWRYIFWGGDMLTADLVDTFQAANPTLRQVNFYGSTETPQAVAYHVCDDEDHSRRALPIGRATGPTRLSIIDRDEERLETNEVGEVLVETAYTVATQDAPAVAGVQRYRTGDRGYLLPDQSVMLIGRADDQVKIRGYRVELADVTRHIRSLDGVADAVVLTEAGPDGEPQLVAHVVSQGVEASLGATIRQRLARSVPSYMVPARVIAHAALPLLPNGKINRAALCDRVESDQEQFVPAAVSRRFTAGERRIAEVFEKLLGRAVATPTQTFADLGADSLNSVHAMLRLEAIIPALPDDWYELSVEELARLLPEETVSQRAGIARLVRSVRVDPAVILRAAAIVLIVAFHYKLLSIGGGLTFVLFMLAGVTFARFQLGVARETGATSAISRSLVKIAIISFPIALVMGLRRILGDMPGGWWMIGFGANFIDYASLPAKQQVGVWLWFIGCYVQMVLGMLLLLRVSAVRRLLAADTAKTLLVAFLVMASLRFLIPAVFNTGGLDNIQAVSIWTFIPTAHAGTFLLGALLEASGRHTLMRWTAIALGVCYALATTYYFPGNEPLLTAGAILMVGLVTAVPVPRLAAQVAVLVSQASLYIYLLHEPVHSVLDRIGLGSPALSLAIAVPLILFSAMLFDRVYDKVAGSIRFGRGRQVGETADGPVSKA